MTRIGDKFRMNLLWGTAASILFVFSVNLSSASDLETGPAVDLESFRSHSRFAIRADESVEPIWKDRAGGFELLMKGLWLADLGAPLGAEADWMAKALARLKDDRLASVQFEETPQGLTIRGTWKFATGKDRPAEPTMERFDFREKTPARYVVDFWPKKGPTVAEVEAARERERRMAERKALEDMRNRRVERKVASQKEREQAEDLGRFCREPLSAETDIFLPFYPVHERIELSRWIPSTTADADFEYVEPASSSRDAQYMRLALDLYRQGKPALAIKTADFFDAEHPKSPFGEQMRFLRANAMLKLGHVTQAEEIFKELGRLSGKSAVTIKSAIFLAAKAYERNYYLGALEAFTSLSERFPQHSLNWVFHLAAAETLYALKQGERAAKEYQWVTIHGPDPKGAAQAALRLGDLYLDRQQYERALAAYFQGLRRFGDKADIFPAVFVNRAEALYWLEDFDRATEAFTSFLEKFPSHPAGWRATLRIGEIYARKADAASQKKARDSFYETVNRYPFSPGATLARLRLLPCGDHGGFDLSASEVFFDREAKNFKTSQIDVRAEKYHDLRALARVQTFISLGTATRSVDVAIEEVRMVGTPRARERIVTSLSELFRRSILDQLAAGKGFEALKFYESRRPKVPRLETDPDFLMKLSQAASDLGLGTFASELSGEHGQAMAELIRRGKGRELASHDPSDLDVRLKQAERAFTEAKALWIAVGTGSEKGEGLEKKLSRVTELLSLVPEESEFSYERELILGLLNERSGRPASALNHAVRSQLMMPANSKREDAPRVDFWVSRLQGIAGSKKAAIDGLRKIQAMPQTGGAHGKAAALGVAAVPSRQVLVLNEAELLSEQKLWGEAANAYAKAVDEGFGGNHALYRYAQALKQNGDAESGKKARAALEKIVKSETNDFWKKLAKESLETASKL